MSTTSPISPISSTNITSATKVGLGYGIAISISILFLISTIMLTSYACIRVKTGGRHDNEDDEIDNGGPRGSEAHQRPNAIAHQEIPIGLPGPMRVKVGWDKQPKKGITYPEVVLGESKRLPKPNNGPCSICLSEYKPKEIVRCMPECNHCFHVKCIDQWLKVGPTCPLCRSSPSTTPAGTPLSELVPLAFHPR